MSDEIWENPETTWKEFMASNLQSDFLEKEGVSVRNAISDIPTAFVAEWGKDGPIIGFVGE